MSFDAATISLLRKKIAEAKEDAGAKLIAGLGIDDFSRYRYSVGYIEALNQIEKLIDEIQTDLMKG